jgi:hypothetical protein
MTTRVRDHAGALLLGALGAWAMSFVALYGIGWNDYSTEVQPAYDALTSGHVWQFLSLAPGYGGSLELRAPFALLTSLAGGNEDAIYRAVSIPCLVVAALFGVWLLARMRALGRSRLARATAFGLCLGNPVTLYALQYGHAEELLGAVLCVVAVLAAQRGAWAWSALALGLAIANKEWAVLAIGPVLVALPTHRWRTLAAAGALAACFYVPLLAPGWLAHAGGGGGGAGATAVVASSSAGSIFQPWQLWWFLGSHGHLIEDTFGIVKVGYRAGPGWVQTLTHPLLVAVSVPITLLVARRRGADAMLLLALLLALRSALDTWDTVYYPLPFLFALLAWEALGRRRPPVLALAASVAVWLVFIVAPERLSADAQAVLYLVVAVPALAALAVELFAPGALAARLRRAGAASDPIDAEDPARRSSGAQAAPIPTV